MMKQINALLYVFLFLIISTGALFSQEMQNNEAKKLFNEGNQKIRAGNFDGAIKDYTDALKIEEHYMIYSNRGIAYKKLNQFENAKKDAEKAINLNPNFEDGFNLLASIYFTMGNYQEALNNFEKALELSKNNNDKTKIKKNLSLTYTRLGSGEEKNANSSKAIEYYKKATEISNYDQAYLFLAKLYTELGEWDKAINAAQNALKYRSSGGKGGPQFYMGVAYKGKGDIAKAKEMFNEAKKDATYKKSAEYELDLLQ